QTSSVINYTFTNLSGVDLHSLAFNPQISGGSGFQIVSNGCGDSIAANAQCVIQVQLIGSSSAEVGTAYLDITGKSGSGEAEKDFSSQSGVINYYVADAAVADKLVIISPRGSESNLSILGNGIESASATFTISNPGTNAIALSSIDLTGVNVPVDGLSISQNNCGSSLSAGGTCKVIVEYGPLKPESNNSGVANLQIKYGNGNVITGTINYSVLALDSHLLITNVVASNGFIGNGTQGDKYHGTGCNTNPLTITITYKNMSTNFMATNLALNLIDGNVPPYYTVDTNQTTCGYGASPKNLNIGASCNLVLVAERSNMKYNDSFNLDITYPSASWNTTQGFISQNGFTYNDSTKLYVDYTQPALVSTVSPESGTSLTRVLTQNLVNANSCGDFITNIGAVSHESSIAVDEGNCNLSDDGSVSCTNNSTSATNKLSYQIDNLPESANIFMLFNTETSGKQLWYNPGIVMFNVDVDNN
ncbi:MAG: hypothetical protein PHC75_04850, partial [Burkholderiales bacterium]|nr:hypothetical protein [Burkholderiales bacterium]